jgi:hypothetical protein
VWICLAISKGAAAFMYLSISVVFFSKMKFTISLLQTLPYADIWPFHLVARAHVYCGKAVLSAAWVHTLFHLLRYMLENKLVLLASGVSVSGYGALVLMSVVCSVWWDPKGKIIATFLTWPRRLIYWLKPSWEL